MIQRGIKQSFTTSEEGIIVLDLRWTWKGELHQEQVKFDSPITATDYMLRSKRDWILKQFELWCERYRPYSACRWSMDLYIDDFWSYVGANQRSWYEGPLRLARDRDHILRRICPPAFSFKRKEAEKWFNQIANYSSQFENEFKQYLHLRRRTNEAHGSVRPRHLSSVSVPS